MSFMSFDVCILLHNPHAIWTQLCPELQLDSICQHTLGNSLLPMCSYLICCIILHLSALTRTLALSGSGVALRQCKASQLDGRQVCRRLVFACGRRFLGLRALHALPES